MSKSYRRKAEHPYVPSNIEEMPYTKWRVEMLPLFQFLCGRMAFWRRCPLPRCRRARTCCGSNDLNRRDDRFPPCMRDDDDHAALLRELRCYIAEVEQVHPAAEGTA